MKELRRKKLRLGLTYQEISDYVGVHLSYLPRYEKGELIPEADHAWKLAEILQIPKIEMFKMLAKAKEERRKQKHE